MTMDAARLPGWLQECRVLFGRPPRSMTLRACQAFQIHLTPQFLAFIASKKDKLGGVLRDQELLRREGRVVWGSLVQANSLLFDPQNRVTCPGNVIYSPDPWFDGELPWLRGISDGLFGLKGKHPDDKELAAFAWTITDEMDRAMRLPVPRRFCAERTVYFTSCFLQPSHLPGGFLKTGFFPVVICPERTESVMVLPASYWPEEFQAAWLW